MSKSLKDINKDHKGGKEGFFNINNDDYYNSNFNNHLENKEEYISFNVKSESKENTKREKGHPKEKRVEEFKSIRAKRINHSIINCHSIIDYSINQSDRVLEKDKNQSNVNNNSVIDMINKKEKQMSDLIHEKIKIKNEQIKDLIQRTKNKGHYGPYFSLCKNCNEKNNEFYEKLNSSSAIKLLNLINNK